MQDATIIFWPVLAQVALALATFILLGVRKAKAATAEGFDRKKAALDSSAWSNEVVQVSNNLANQFETPVLFYVLCFTFFNLNAVNLLVLVSAWVYVIGRYIHTYIHVTSNYVPLRLRFFLISTLCLLFMAFQVAWALI